MSRIFKVAFAFAMVLCFTAAASLHAEDKTVHVIEFPEFRWEIPEKITLTVVDENDKPLADMPVSFSVRLRRNETSGIDLTGENNITIPDLLTDANGKVVVEIPQKAHENPLISIDFTVPKKGLFMSRGVGWSTEIADDSGLITVPEEAKVAIREGKMFRLKVVDEDGNPVEGAQVGDIIDIFGDTFPNRQKNFTDENGVCSWGPMPKGSNERQILYTTKVYHSDYVRWPIGHQYPGTNSRFSENIVDEYTVTLKRGRTISGVVLNADGQPVEGADVFVGGQQQYAEKETQTDENGKFQIHGLLDLPLVLVVRKPGMVRFVKKILPENIDDPQTITMQTAKTLRVQLMTDEGRPYPSQFGLEPFAIDLGRHTYSYNLSRGSRSSDGLWEWDEAPDEECGYRPQFYSYSAPAPGEKQKRYTFEKNIYTFRPREEPYQIVLKTEEVDPGRNLNIYQDAWILPETLELCVLDEDGKPKPEATVSVACYVNNEWSPESRKVVRAFTTDADGIVRFDFSKVRHSRTFDLRISAEGCRTTYCSWQSDTRRGFRRFGKPIGERLDVLIASTQKTTGFVYDEEGQPVEGAVVTLRQISNCTYGGEPHQTLRATNAVMTDANGKWECPLILPEIPPARYGSYLNDNYVEITKEGYLTSKTPVAANERIVTLKRTKKISGRVIDQQGNPITDVRIDFGGVSMSDRVSPNVRSKMLLTDQDGRFETAASPAADSKEAGILAIQKDWQMAWQSLDLSHDVENLELVLQPNTNLRLRFDHAEGVPFPNMSIRVALDRQPQIGPSFPNLKPDKDGVLILENAPAPTPDIDVTVSLYVTDDSPRYRPENDRYVFKYGDEEVRIPMVDIMTLPEYRQRYGTYSFEVGTAYGSISYNGDPPQTQ